MNADTPRGTPIRRPGSPWRLLVHEYVGKQPDGTLYGTSHHVSNDREVVKTEGRYRAGHQLPANTEFDELVVGRWLHVEQMDATRWWMNVGGVTLWIDVDREGRPRRVDVYGPGEHAEAVDGCEYTESWGTA
jgi:hypothetical protein